MGAIQRPGGGVWLSGKGLLDPDTDHFISKPDESSSRTILTDYIHYLPATGLHQLQVRHLPMSTRMRNLTYKQAQEVLHNPEPATIHRIIGPDPVLVAAIRRVISSVQNLADWLGEH